MTKSALQIARAAYQPKVPAALKGAVKAVDGEYTQSVADQDEIKKLFPNTYGMPVVTFEKSNEKKELPAMNVGVILSGGQAPGGHNVIAGLFDGIKANNAASRLYGFILGPGGLIDHKYMELTADIIDEYRNTGGFDMIGSGRTKLETKEQFDKGLEILKELDIKALVIIGGIKRISTVAQVVVPFMALLYVVVVLIILFTHLSAIPGAIVEIVQSAFGLRAAAGGTLGSILIAMQMGIARGIFSNEAGLGSAPIAAAAAKTNEPVTQGLVSMLGTIIDTVIICTMTGLSIVITGAWDMGLEGVSVTTKAFQMGLPFPEQVASFVLMLCLVFFAFTTILGWNYYSEKCLEYLVGDKKTVLKGYRWLYILAVFIGPFMTVSAVWTIADIFNGLMALPNLVALVALSGVVVAETKKYFEKQKY